jgi:predicted short-subunit dehydrogenase-like oxidoreductase (DUF2520 family)
MTAGLSVLDHVWVVGPGRLGLALGSVLLDSGQVGRLSFTGRNSTPPVHPIFESGAAEYSLDLPTRRSAPTVILISVPDSEISAVGAALTGCDIAPAAVFHTSGVLGSEVLAPLAALGHHIGSIHPMVAMADPVAGSGKLRGAWYGIEGVPEAVAAAELILDAVKGRALQVDPSGKPMYHAAAVFASNYLVALLGIAEDLMTRAGVDAIQARSALMELATGTIDNVATSGPVRALTGPVARGDETTLRLHLRGLSPNLRPLYSGLAREALRLASLQGLDPVVAMRITSLLEAESY